MQQVRVDPLDLRRLERILPPERAETLRTRAIGTAEQLRGRVVWNVNATAKGGGVAEMLQVLLAYGRGAAQSAAWSTVSRAVAPLLLAGAAGVGARGYPVGFALAAAIGVAGAVVAYRSLLVPPPTTVLALAGQHR